MKANAYLNEWVLWGGIPYRRGEVYRWMQENGIRFFRAVDEPALDPDEALALRKWFEEQGVIED